MKVLAITSNPESHSLTDAVGKAFVEGAAAGGAQVELLDLYAEAFNPVYTLADREHYLDRGAVPDDVAALQRRLASADVIALVFPVYWCTMPAMVKGLFDRVICRGFAYGREGLPGALAGKTVRILALTGGSEDWYRSSGMDKALEFQICDRTFRHYCSVEDVSLHYIGDLSMGDDSQEARDAAAGQLGKIALMGESLARRKER